jgi:hypothetical protein
MYPNHHPESCESCTIVFTVYHTQPIKPFYIEIDFAYDPYASQAHAPQINQVPYSNGYATTGYNAMADPFAMQGMGAGLPHFDRSGAMSMMPPLRNKKGWFGGR